VCKIVGYGRQDFDNEGFFNDVTIQPPTTSIAMIPPTSESEANVSVHFDPLPDPRDLQWRQHSNYNASQLRPKVAQIGHDKVDSDDEGDAVTNELLLLQERVKLEKLLCKYCLHLNYIRTADHCLACVYISVNLFGGMFLLDCHKWYVFECIVTCDS